METLSTSWARRVLGWVLLCMLLLLVKAAHAQSVSCTGTDPGGQPATNGLYAEVFTGFFQDDQAYFNDRQNPSGLQKTVGQVNFPTTASWGNLLPVASGTAQDPDQFSVRLRGSLLISTPGTYTFYITSDDAAYLWLDEEALALTPSSATALIDNGGEHTVRTRSMSVALTAGPHSVLMHYGDACCDNALVWEYEGPGISRQVVPSGALCTAQQAGPLRPRALTYTPASQTLIAGGSVSSGIPVVDNGGASVTGFALANTTALPGSIIIDATTGVVSVGTSVPAGTYGLDVAATNANGTTIFRNAYRVLVTPAPLGGCGGTDPGGNPATAGLYTEYFPGYFNGNTSFFAAATPGLVRTDPQVNFPAENSWGNLTGVASGPVQAPDNFSARLRSSLYIPVTGSYTFYLTSDDAAYLWLDNAALDVAPSKADAVIDNGGNHPARTISATLRLEAGLHNLLILYGDDSDGNALTLEFASAEAGITRQLVPTAQFCTSVQPLRPVATALAYLPAVVRVQTGNQGASGLPVASSSSAVVEYSLENAADLPAGITLNATTGRVQIASGVPLGNYALTIGVRNAGSTAIFTNAVTVSIIPVPPTGCRGVNPDGTLATSGLFAEYYPGYFGNDLSFFDRTPVGLTRSENQLDFDETTWGNLSGLTSGALPGAEGFSARFRGRILITTPGTYNFRLTSDDGSLLWLDAAALAPSPTVATALIDNRGIHPATTVSNTRFLTAGLHDIQIIYGDNSALSVLRLEYESTDAGVPLQIVPIADLCTTTSAAPLPVVLARFTAEPAAAGIKLAWETAQELNSDYFEVERSANGQVFEPVERRKAAGTINQRQAYTLTDRAPLPGTSYYRLRQVDLDGTAHFSSVVAVKWSGSAAQQATAAVFPNPTSGRFTVRLQQPTEQPVKLELLDMQGRVLRQETISGQAAKEHTVQPGHLPAGLYLLRLTTTTGRITQRLAIE
jgi:hypothetical protein